MADQTYYDLQELIGKVERTNHLLDVFRRAWIESLRPMSSDEKVIEILMDSPPVKKGIANEKGG
jgi:hypothetical protein